MGIVRKETRHVVVLATLALALLLGWNAGPAKADGDEEGFGERVRAFTKAVGKHRCDRDQRALLTDLALVKSLHEEALREEAEKERKALVKAVGSLTKGRDDELRTRALETLGTLGDADGARYLKPFLKPLKGARGAALSLAAIDAAGKIGDEGLVSPLLKMVDKSKHFGAAGRAMAALSHFKDSKRHRERILEELVGTLRRDVPGGPKRGRESQVAEKWIPGKSGSNGTDRWNALSSQMVKACNDLTGQNVASALDWIETLRTYKRNLDALFTD